MYQNNIHNNVKIIKIKNKIRSKNSKKAIVFIKYFCKVIKRTTLKKKKNYY